MNHLKGALTDYIYDNFNKSKQGKVLKQNEPCNGIPLPLKDSQIKVAERDQVLVKQGGITESSLKITAKGSAIKLGGPKAALDKFGMPKKENFKEYDLKTNQIVEVRKKKKKTYEADSDASVERWVELNFKQNDLSIDVLDYEFI